MNIKSYRTKRFAGLRDFKIEFAPGLNVILGPNEAGKSTIINGIHASLFKDISLRRSVNADNDFIYSFMPYNKGDYIDSELVFSNKDGEYRLRKEWGSQKSIELLMPNNEIIKDERKAKRELGKLLKLSKETYTNIVFARQRDLKESLIRISEDPNISREITDILRRTLMELDGVSIDVLETRISEELKELYNRWDVERNYPENNRGIHNPYKQGLGKIVESYYKKEKLRLKKDEVREIETEFEKLSRDIKDLEGKKSKLVREKVRLENIEGDINKRAILSLELKDIEKILKDAMEINKLWPIYEERLDSIHKEIKSLEDEEKKLKSEKNLIEDYRKKINLKNSYEKARDLDKKIKDEEDKLNKFPKIDSDILVELEQISTSLENIETKMKLGDTTIKVKELGRESLLISENFTKWKKLEVDEKFEGKGLIRLRYGKDLELEIKMAELDFKNLNEKRIVKEKEYKKKLENLGVQSIEEAHLYLEEIKEVRNRLYTLVKEKEIILAGKSIDSIKKELDNFDSLKDIRDEEVIDMELEKLISRKIDLIGNSRIKEESIEKWKKQYGDIDNLFNIVVDKKTEEKIKLEEIKKLAQLPKDFESTEAFTSRIKQLRLELESIDQILDNKISEYYDLKNRMSEDTYEDIKEEYLAVNDNFNNYLKKGEKLRKIERVFLETKEEMLSDPMESLVKEFSSLLEVVTGGDYSLGEIDEDLNIHIKKEEGKIPVDLLSAGTYDAVSLALRFALISYIFKDKEGFVVLDDCLVDLDPLRKKKSIKLIQEFSKDYQLIFTTCNLRTAEDLGGNLIKLI